jgi:type III restriction enzyme
MPKTRTAEPQQLSALDVQVKTAPCVPGVQKAVSEWRSKRYPGITDTTKQLLNYWFHTDHRLPNGLAFSYHYSQREAIETLIYLFEVANIRRHKTLLETFATSTPDLRLLQYDDFARYTIKMATGSGKTKVMSLAVAWQYFNATLERRDDFATTFLLVAPNVIVFERLRIDFAGGRIFRSDPVIPPELSLYWDMDVYLRGEGERATSTGALYLTNIQQLYERPSDGHSDEPDVMTAVLGPKPPASLEEPDRFSQRIAERGGHCLVVNDEAHHTHDEESEWNKTIRRLNESLPDGLSAQLDFSATPRYSKGSLFTWTVYDYPLKQAINWNKGAAIRRCQHPLPGLPHCGS